MFQASRRATSALGDTDSDAGAGMIQLVAQDAHEEADERALSSTK